MVERKAFIPTLGSTLLAALVAVALPARAQDTTPQATPGQDAGRNGEDRVFFDFNSKSLVVYGFHSSKTQGRKNGVDAEMAARREGKQVLLDYFENTCKKSPYDSDWTSRVKVKSGWNGTALTSQGSEIFPEALLLIKLTASLSNAFSKYPPVKVNAVKNAQGESFVFHIPPLPGHLLRCGTIPLKLSASRRVVVAPGFVGGLAENTTTIKMTLGKDALEAASPTDAEALKRSELGIAREGENDNPTSPTLLPVVGK